jgi:hypothetical protein
VVSAVGAASFRSSPLCREVARFGSGCISPFPGRIRLVGLQRSQRDEPPTVGKAGRRTRQRGAFVNLLSCKHLCASLQPVVVLLCWSQQAIPPLPRGLIR